MKTEIKDCKTCGDSFCCHCADDPYIVNCDDCFYATLEETNEETIIDTRPSGRTDGE